MAKRSFSFHGTGRLVLSSALFAVLIAAGPVFAQDDSVLDRLAGDTGRSSSGTDPELSQRHSRRGNTYSNLERHEDAITEYRLSLAADPNNSESLRGLANIYLFQERAEEAIPLLARYIRLNQNTLTAALISSQHSLGQILRDAGRWDEAVEVDLLSIQAEPNNDSQVYVMGNTYFNAGRTDLATRIYETAIEVLPPNAFLHRTLGRIYESERRLEDALAQYRAAAELDPDSQFYKDLITATEARLAQ